MEFFVPFKDVEICVELEGDIQIQNDGIGSYEFWGMKGYDAGVDYKICETITWDRTLYSDEQNNAINNYVQSNWDYIESEIVSD